MQLFNFHDGHVITFRQLSGAYSQMPGQRLSRLAKSLNHTFGVSAFHRYHWFAVKLFHVGSAQAVRRTVEGYPKNAKKLFFIWLRPRYKIPAFFTIAPVLTSTSTVCRRNRGDPSSLCRTSRALQILQKTQSFWFCWSRPRADRDLSWPTSVFRTTTGLVRAKFYPERLRFGSQRTKSLFWNKNRERPGLCLAVKDTSQQSRARPYFSSLVS